MNVETLMIDEQDFVNMVDIVMNVMLARTAIKRPVTQEQAAQITFDIMLLARLRE